MIQFQVVIIKSPTEPPKVNLASKDELATVIQELEKGDTVIIERIL